MLLPWLQTPPQIHGLSPLTAHCDPSLISLPVPVPHQSFLLDQLQPPKRSFSAPDDASLPKNLQRPKALQWLLQGLRGGLCLVLSLLCPLSPIPSVNSSRTDPHVVPEHGLPAPPGLPPPAHTVPRTCNTPPTSYPCAFRTIAGAEEALGQGWGQWKEPQFPHMNKERTRTQAS